MYREKIKKFISHSLAIILAAATVFSVQGTADIYAEDNDPVVWVDGNQLNNYCISGGTNMQAVTFGEKQWYVAAQDLIEGQITNNYILICSPATAFGSRAFWNDGTQNNYEESSIRHYLTVTKEGLSFPEEEYALSTFTEAEQGLIKGTNIAEVSNEGDKLYLPAGTYGETAFKVGKYQQETSISLQNAPYNTGDAFWLRQAGSSEQYALAAVPGNIVSEAVVSENHQILPAMCLDLSLLFFASAAPAATAGTSFQTDAAIPGKYALTLRYYDTAGKISSNAYRSADAVRVTKGQETTDVYLYVQDNEGVGRVWSTKVEGDAYYSIDNIFPGTFSLDSCRIWLETVDGNLAYAKFADTYVPAVESVTLDQTQLNFTVGDAPALLTATVSPGDVPDTSVIWASNNEAVAVVDANGYVTPVGEGSATIYVASVADNTKVAACEVNVAPYIPPAKLNLTVTGYSGVYDGGAHYVSASTEITEGTVISYSTNGTEWSWDVPYICNVGSFTVYVKAENPGCETETAEAVLEVTPAYVTVTANDASKAYGAEEPVLTASVAGLVNEEPADIIIYSLYREAGEEAGTYAIIPQGEATQGNYAVSYVPGTFTITPPAPKINLVVNGYTGVYDGAAHYVSTATEITEGTVITYSTNGTDWSLDVPYITNVGSFTVYVKAENPNCETETAEAVLEVTPASVTVTANDAFKAYGAEEPALTASVAGLVNEEPADVIVYTIYREAGEEAGAYAIIPQGEASQGNYAVSYVPGTITITPPAPKINLTVNGYSGIYDGAAHYVSAATEITEGTVISYSTNGAEWSIETPSITNVGSFTVYVKAENPNCETETAEAVLEVTPASVTVTANDATKAFGAEEPALTANVAGLVNEEPADIIVYTIYRYAGEEAGTYAIIPQGEAAQGNYTVSYVPGTFTITPPAPKINLTVNGYTGVYDGIAHYVSATSEITEGTVISYSTNGTEWSAEAPSITNVGTFTVYVKAENPNCETETAEAVLEVTQAAVTVTANDASKAYEAADPTFTATVTGLVNGETEDKITYTISREAGEAAGTYAIIPAGEASQGNYAVSYVPGTFTITPPAPKLNLVVNGYTGVYDGIAHYVSATTEITEGTVISYSTNGAEWSVETPSITNVGSFTVYVKAENPNCETETAEAVLEVTQAAVTVTANDASKAYEAADPTFTATVTGLVNGETEDKITYTISREAGEAAGTYAIVPAGEASQGNYAVSYVPGTFTINPPAPKLNLVVNGYTGVYDGVAHYVSASTEITEGTVISYSTNGKDWSVEIPSITNVGSFTVYVKAENPVCETETAETTLEVKQAAATVTANNASKVYEDADPTFTATVTGLVNGETEDKITYTISREAGEAAGTYAIIPAGEASQGNYAVSYVNGTFTINPPAPKINLKANGYSGVYDGKSHNVSTTVEITEGTVVSYSTNGTDWSVATPSITNVGSFKVYVKAENPNCETETAEVTLEVTPAAVTVTAKDASKTYGAADPAYTATVAGLVNGETEDKITYTISRDAGEEAGTYAIIPTGEASQGNYAVSYVNGTFTINPPAPKINLKANGYSGAYDGKSHTVSATVEITEGTVISYSTNGTDWSQTAPSLTDIGKYTVHVKAENPKCAAETVDVTLEVTPAAVTVTANDASKAYGASDPSFTAAVTGLVNNETEDKIKYTVSRVAGEEAGTYAIIPAGEASQGNYAVTYVNGKFTIIPPAPKLNLSAGGYLGVYDGLAHSVVASTDITEGTVISYSTNGTDWSTQAPSIINVGSFTVHIKAENPKCETETADVTLEVAHAPVTVTANSTSKAYGAADPVFTATIAGLVNNETIDKITYTISRTAGEKPGTYAIVPFGETTQGNYMVSYNNGTFTIGEKIEYTVAGDGSTVEWTKGNVSGMTVTVNASKDDDKTLTKFRGAMVDKIQVQTKDMIVSNGSLIFTLKASYMELLSAGDHTLDIIFTDGQVSVPFTIKEKATPTPTATPAATQTPTITQTPTATPTVTPTATTEPDQNAANRSTGDPNNRMLWIMLIVAAAAVVAVVLIWRKKKGE